MPWLAVLEDNYQVMLEEVKEFKTWLGSDIDKEDLYPGYTNVYGEEKWELIHSKVYEQNIEVISAHFPKTLKLIEQNVPKASSIMFSCLPGSRKGIPKHSDYKNGTLRLHLGLQVPDSSNDVLIFDDQRLTWKEGESFVIDATREHSVSKDSNQERIVLLVDFVRPTTPFFEWLSYGMFIKLRGAYEGINLNRKYTKVVKDKRA
jgi:beta-hydroxylase